ncbi:hypothetical protein DKX38_017983 [Salix brachista]|uniref:EamA domain-containing protein n=1 Tax=Salix brachista TaxID=2182728 RepID=A0A5N5KWT1_9ROSI|nr:hypothetical protein DKX38_017983 [Salix brachista]
MNMQSSAPYAAMVLVQLSYGGSNILMKIALEKGLNQLVFVVYRHIIAMILLAPFAFVIERKQRPPLSLSVMIKIFVLSSLGTTIHLNVYYAGLAYTSPTVASALSNVIPSLTFIMAVLLGMEKVKTESPRGWAKMLGTAICVCGSLVFTFWKGGYLFKSFENRPLINIYSTKGSSGEYRHAKENWIKGAALILTSHAVVYKVYPARLSLTTLICFFASIQSSFLALCFARTPAIWKLDWNVQLLTIIYCGVVISALVYYLQTWCISHKGPVFVAMFSPLLVVIVGLFSAIAFAERLHLGSLVGTGLIVLGLYCVLWGKGQDNSAAQKPDEGKGLADDKTLEISINDHPLTNPDTGERNNVVMDGLVSFSILGAILIDRGPYGFLWGRIKAEKQEIHISGSSDIEKDSVLWENDELLCIPLKRKQFMNMQARAPYAEMGLNLLVFVVYRHIIAMTLLGPFAFVIERMEKVKTASPRGWAKMLGAAICTSGSLGVLNSALVYYLQTWRISRKRPVFATMFCPPITFAERIHCLSPFTS